MFLIVAACAARGCAVAQNVHKRYLIHVAGFNLGILMRAMFGQGTPRRTARAPGSALLFFVQSDSKLAVAVILAIDGETAMLVIIAPVMS